MGKNQEKKVSEFLGTEDAILYSTNYMANLGFFATITNEALGTTEKWKEMVRRGDLLAFADDMLILTNSKAEMTQAI